MSSDQVSKLKPTMPRLYPPDEDLDLYEAPTDDYASLERQKMTAEAHLAVEKLAVWNHNEALLTQANELTAWRRHGRDGD